MAVSLIILFSTVMVLILLTILGVCFGTLIIRALTPFLQTDEVQEIELNPIDNHIEEMKL